MSSHFHLGQEESSVAKTTIGRGPGKLVLFCAAAAALFVQASTGWADTRSDINTALGDLGFALLPAANATTIPATPTADQVRQAVARTIYTHASTPAAAGQYVAQVLALRYPTQAEDSALSATLSATDLTARSTNVAVILNGGLQGLRALGNTTPADYNTVALAAAGVTYSATTLDAAREAIGAGVVTQLKTGLTGLTTVGSSTAFLQNVSGAPASIAANPDLAGATAPVVASGLLSTYAVRDVTRDATITYKVLAAIPAISGTTFTQAERDADIASVVTTLQGASYITPANTYEYVARLAKGDALSIQTVSQTVAAGLANETDRAAFATGAAGFFTFPNGTTGTNAGSIVLPDATKGLLAAGISLAATGHEGDIAAAIAGTMATADLTSANQTLAGQVGNANALDVRRAVVLAGVDKALPTNAAAITTQYLTALPITIEANAPAFAATVVKALPVIVNNTNRDDFAGTTGAVAGKFAAVNINDTHFQTDAGIVRAVVVAVPTFAEETVRVVAAQVQSNLNAIGDQGSVAVAFANDIVVNVGTSKMADATKALVAQGIALAFVGQEGKVAQAIADAPTAAASPTPTAASRAAIAAAVAKAVPSATQDIAARVASSLGTVATGTGPNSKIAFGAALIPLLPATSGVTDAAKSIAAGLADPAFSTFANDGDRIAFAESFATFSAATKAVAVSSLIAGGVATQLTNMATDAPLLAAGVASAVNVAASTPSIAAEVARVAPATSAGNVAFAVANLGTPALTDATKTLVASAVLGAVALGSQGASAPDIANQIAGIEVDASKAALTTALAKIVYSNASSVGSVAKNISDHVTSSTTPSATTQISPADTIRYGIASAALKSGLPTTFNAAEAPAIVAAANAIAQSGIVAQLNTPTSMANLANTLVLAVPTYLTQVVGVSNVAGDIAIAVAQQLASPADKAAAANAATKAITTQAATIAAAVANYGAGTDTLSPHPLNDAGKALVAQKVVLAATTQALAVTTAIVGLVDGDGVPANVNQSKANVAKAVVTSAPTQAVGIAQNVAAPNDAALRILVAQGVAQGLPVANATSAGPVAAAVAELAGNSVTTKASIASTVTVVIPLQAVDIADKVATANVAADKAIIAAAVVAVIPGAQQTSATEGAAAVAAKVAGEIAAGGVGAAGQIAAIAQAVAGAGGNVPLTIAPDIAKAVATKFATTLAAAAPTISSAVASVSGLVIADQAAIAKAVATAVAAQASAVATTTLTTSLTLNAGTTMGTTPDAIAGVFAVAIPLQAAPIAGSATSFYAGTYLAAHPGTTIRAGDIAVSVATSTGVAPAAIPAIATQVAQAIFPSNRAAIGGIADKFAAGVGTTPGTNLGQTNFNSQAPAIATNLGTVAAPTGRESSELAGIVDALVEALPVTTAANMTMVATIAKNVALVAKNYWAAQAPTVAYQADDIVGFLVAELLARGASNSVGTGSVLAALKTALTTTGSPISSTTVDAVFNVSGGVVHPNPAYASAIVGAGLGTIGEVLSNTTPVTNF